MAGRMQEYEVDMSFIELSEEHARHQALAECARDLLAEISEDRLDLDQMMEYLEKEERLHREKASSLMMSIAKKISR